MVLLVGAGLTSGGPGCARADEDLLARQPGSPRSGATGTVAHSSRDADPLAGPIAVDVCRHHRAATRVQSAGVVHGSCDVRNAEGRHVGRHLVVLDERDAGPAAGVDDSGAVMEVRRFTLTERHVGLADLAHDGVRETLREGKDALGIVQQRWKWTGVDLLAIAHRP